MPTLTIGDQSVQVDDKFMSLDPAQQNAAVEEIASSLGVKAQAQPQNSLAGSAKALGTGVAEGAIGLAGLPADAINLAARGVDYLAGTHAADALSGLNKFGSENIKHAIESQYGELPKPQTTAEKYLHSIGSFAPAALTGPGGIARRIATNVIAPGVASEAAGQLAEGTGYEPVARVAGALGGGIAASKAAQALTATKGIPAVPTRAQIGADTSAGYNSQAVKDLEINPTYAARVSDQIQNNLEGKRFSAKDPDVAKVYNLLEDLKKPEIGYTHRITDFENTRRRLNEIAAKGSSEGAAAKLAIRSIDAATLRIPTSYVVAGDARAASADLFNARKSAATGFRSDLVQGFLEKATNTASATHSGGNLENEIYKQVRSALNSPSKYLRGWTAQEKEALRSVLPGHGRGALRRAGKILGGGGGLGQLASGAAGTAMFGPAGMIALPALGLAANKAGSAIAQSKLNSVDELLRSRAPSYAPSYAQRQAALNGGVFQGLPSPEQLALQGILAARLQLPDYAGR